VYTSIEEAVMLHETVFEELPFLMDNEKDELQIEDLIYSWSDIELTQRINDAIARTEHE
jgi:hypothetical protein